MALRWLQSSWRILFLNTQAEKPRRRRPGGTALLPATESVEVRTLLAAINVTTFDDVVDANDGETSLREAIIQANTTAGDDEIILEAGNYNLTIPGRNENATATGDLDILDNGTLTITGEGADQTTINASKLNDRVFHVHTDAVFTLEGITVTGGQARGRTADGGGLLNAGDEVTITDCIFSDNRSGQRGGGLANTTGTVTITGSSFNGNRARSQGGGLYNYEGEIEITDSTFSANRSKSRGGGLGNLSGNVTIDSSTFNANRGSQGGGFYVSAGEVTIVNSTLSRNRASTDGGGLQNLAGTVTIEHSTLIRNRIGRSGRGGAIETSNELVTLHNTIVAGNLRGRIVNDIQGTLDSDSSFNLVTNFNTRGGLTHGGANGNIIGVNGSGIRRLDTVASATLADNGGPTRTHLLVTGSVALNAGDPTFAAPPDDDQRDENRVKGGRLDIGSVEI